VSWQQQFFNAKNMSYPLDLLPAQSTLKGEQKKCFSLSSIFYQVQGIVERRKKDMTVGTQGENTVAARVWTAIQVNSPTMDWYSFISSASQSVAFFSVNGSFVSYVGKLSLFITELRLNFSHSFLIAKRVWVFWLIDILCGLWVSVLISIPLKVVHAPCWESLNLPPWSSEKYSNSRC